MDSHTRPATAGPPKVVARPPTVALLVALLSAGLALAGCGGDPTTTPPGGGGQPTGTAPAGDPDTRTSCDLFSQEEAAAVAGNPVAEGKLLGIVCIWEPEDLDDDTNVQVSVAHVPAPPGADVDAACQAGLLGIPDSEPLDGTGLGNSAYWEFESGGLSNNGSLHICFDGGFLDTAAIGLRPEAELQQIALSIAGTVLARL